MTKVFTNNAYPFKHWMTSLAIGIFMQFIYGIFDSSDYKISLDILGWYVIFFGVGLFFSLPIFILCIIFFNILIRLTDSNVIIKLILNLIAIVGVFITVKLIGGTAMTTTLSTIYSIGIIISSLLNKIDNPKVG